MNAKNTVAAALICLSAVSGATAGELIIGSEVKAALTPSNGMPTMGMMGMGTNAWMAREQAGTLRQVLTEWATAAGWTFRPEHWAVSKDFPVHGSGQFNGDFRTAVRGLLSTTDQSDVPVQPCFYSNMVLRVIPKTAMCDRSSLALGNQ